MNQIDRLSFLRIEIVVSHLSTWKNTYSRQREWHLADWTVYAMSFQQVALVIIVCAPQVTSLYLI